MKNNYNEPLYDTDLVSKGYLDKALNNETSAVSSEISIINTTVNNLGNTVIKKAQNFGSQPTPPYYINDTWMNGTDIYICVTQRLLGNFNINDWEKASIYDNTKETVDEGITTTTGGLEVTNTSGGNTVGMCAEGSESTSIRLWAGATKENRASAPFRVNQNGELWATRAVISGEINATNGTISGSTVINGDNITTGTINANRLDSKVITTDNFSAQSINANNITAGTLSAASVKLKNVSLTPTSSTIGGLTVQNSAITSDRAALYAGTGVLQIFNEDGGSMILSNAARLCATAGVGIYSNSNGTLTAPPSNIDLKACSGAEVYLGCMETADGLNEQSSVNCKNGELWLKSVGPIYANKQIVVSSSSLATKENITDLTSTQKKEVYDLIRNIPLKQYDYKKQYGKLFNYGFIIEDIEHTKLKDLLHIEQLDNNSDVKNYSNEDLVRLELVVIQELMSKVETLEQKIVKLEGGTK